jgi:hypothetical protein
MGKARSRQEFPQNIGRFSPSTSPRSALVIVTAQICKPSVARSPNVLNDFYRLDLESVMRHFPGWMRIVMDLCS